MVIMMSNMKTCPFLCRNVLFEQDADFTGTDRDGIYVGDTRAFYFDNVSLSAEDVKLILLKGLMIPIVLSLSLWMFSVWLVFTSNLNSQTTWLKVKF